VVRWNGVLSHSFSVVCGVRQRGVLSPLMFNVHIDDLIRRLESDRLGCCVNGLYIGCIVYADDILLYQHLWHHCRLCLTFVMIMVVSITFCLTPRSLYVLKLAVNGRQLQTDCMRLNNEDIKWVSSCKYLGVMFVTGLTLHVDCG